MKSRQLANVLIKILGLSVLVHGIPTLLSVLLPLWQAGVPGFGVRGEYNGMYFLSPLVLIAIGFGLIFGSREIASFLFPDENE
jgi:hypothetical protein